MRGEVSTAGIAQSVIRIAWQVLRWPLFAFLVVFEPIVSPGHHPLVQGRPHDRGVTCTYAFKEFKEMNKPCNE